MKQTGLKINKFVRIAEDRNRPHNVPLSTIEDDGDLRSFTVYLLVYRTSSEKQKV